MTPKRLLTFTVALWISILAVDHARFREQADRFIQSEFCRAVSSGRLFEVKLLIIAGAQPKNARTVTEVPIILAAENGQTDVVAYLLKAGADVNERGYNPDTALLAAVSNGHLASVRLLVAHGAELNAQGYNYFITPLYIAHEKGYVEIEDFLRQAGARSVHEPLIIY